jgi:diaminopimelate decarboxylase
MDHFQYREGVLHAEKVELAALADRLGTPLYVYSRQTLLDHYDRIHEAFAPLRASICFSVKSCQNLAILRILRERGAWFDVVSGGELARVLEAGGEGSRVAYAGVGKTDDEIRMALQAGVRWFNVESEEELANLKRWAETMRVTAHAALRINPDVDPHTHVYTTTGKRETKFGVDWPEAGRVFRTHANNPNLCLTGLHVHLGSPVNRVDPYVKAVARILDLADVLRAQGHRISAVNLGGGFGAHYDGSEAPSASVYAERLIPMLGGRGLDLYLEPGRSIAANAGVLLTRVLYTKSSGQRRFVIVDAAMTELIRPTLYGAFHFVWPVRTEAHQPPPERTAEFRPAGTSPVDVVGPVCESGDFLAKDRWLPPLTRGDLLCIFSTGAYGFVMSSQYNSRPRSAEVLVEGAEARVIRRRETYDDLVAAERL